MPKTLRITPRMDLVWLLYLFLGSLHGLTSYAAVTNRGRKNEANSSCVCGIPNRQTYIVGGTPTQKNKYPWMVSLHRTLQLKEKGLSVSHFCGGALIANQWIATAAHCTYSSRQLPELITANLGDYDHSTLSESNNVQVKISTIINHPNYVTRKMDYDISLLKMAAPIAFTDTIRPICIPPPNVHLENKMVYVHGWGVTEEDGKVSSVLNEVSIPVMRNSDCSKYYKHKELPITDNMICAGYNSGGKDSCQGDSGGPLIYDIEGSYALVGIVSFGIGCARPQYPGVYTRVTRFISWIDQITQFSTFVKTC